MRNAVDFKYYDITAEDHSAQRDPRSLESLEDVVNPGFDEDGTILRDPLPPQYPRLLQKDRQIFESCAVSGSKILWPHPNVSGVQKHLTVQYIMNKARCTPQEAEYIADSCVALEATKKIVDKFCEWAVKKSPKDLIAYLWKFVIGITEAEAPSDEHEPWEDEPVTAGELQGGIFGQHGLCENEPVEEIELKAKEGPMATMINNKLTWVKHIEDHVGKYLVQDMSEYEEPEETESTPNTIAYHIFKDFNAEEEELWIDKQPKAFIQKLNMIQACKNLADLTELGKTVHGNNGFSRDQAGVVWTEYNSRKHVFEPKHLGLTARSLLKKIIQSNGHIGALGKFLHNVQSEKIKVTPAPTKHEWGIIWETYHRRKEVHQATV